MYKVDIQGPRSQRALESGLRRSRRSCLSLVTLAFSFPLALLPALPGGAGFRTMSGVQATLANVCEVARRTSSRTGCAALVGIEFEADVLAVLTG